MDAKYKFLGLLEYFFTWLVGTWLDINVSIFFGCFAHVVLVYKNLFHIKINWLWFAASY
jgi:hypothetical protein